MMEYEYYYGPGLSMLTGAVIAVCVILGLAAGIAMWLLKSWPVYRIARRRGIRNPWLAWIPVGKSWILGSLSDQYQYLVRGKIRSRRIILPVLSALSGTQSVIFSVAVFSALAQAAAGILFHGNIILSTWAGINSVLILLSLAVGIAAFVFRCLCKYDVYRSCDPGNAAAFTALGILVPVVDIIFLWVCRNLDRGMPPRRDAAQD